MYKVSDLYNQAINNSVRQEKIEGSITLTDGTTIPFDDDKIKELKIDNQCINGEELEFGCVYAGQLSFMLENSVESFKLYGAKIFITSLLQLSDGKYEAVPMGEYYITEAKRTLQYINITALDCMAKMDGNFDDTALSHTPWTLLQSISNWSGIPCANTKAEIESMPNGTEKIYMYSESASDEEAEETEETETLTCRAVLSKLAQLLCGFATATRTGGFKISQFSTTTDYAVSYENHFETSISDYEVGYSEICVVANGEEKKVTMGSDERFTMAIDSNSFFDGTSETTERRIQAVGNKLSKIKYVPSQVSAVSMPFLECGDLVQYTLDGISYNSLITSYVWNYHDRCDYISSGKAPIVKAYNNSDYVVQSFKTLYYESDLDTELLNGTWSETPPQRTDGKYIWQKNVTYYSNGKISESIPVCTSGKDGQDAILLRLDSSKGTVFKNNMASTVLHATIYYGAHKIESNEQLHAVFGSGAYLEWCWQRLDEDRFGKILATDSRISEDGFSFTITPNDVDTKVVFECNLIF